MKKLLKFLLSKSFLFGLLIACQLGLLTALLVMFSRVGTIAYILITLISALVIIAVVEHRNINPAYKIMWLLIVVALPVMGPVLYLLWGKQGVTPKNALKFADIEKRASDALKDAAVTETKLALFNEEPSFRRSVEYLSRYASAPLYDGTLSEYYPMGEVFFPRFLEAIRGAKKSIYMEYFILEEGEMWNTTLDILKEKAAAGVDVRVVYDGLGSMFTLDSDYFEKLRGYGIQCYPFNPMHFSLHISDYKMLNHRDHRKITIVDDEIGFTGGLNFADEYINRKMRFGVWKDTALMLKGPAVYSLSVTFLKMWDFVAGTQTDFAAHFPKTRYDASCYVQPYCDSPLDCETVSENAYINVIRRARNYVCICTPYLVVDNEMVTALCLAAKSGVDVRILTPGIPDKWYVYYVTQSYYPRLLEAGVHIYEYTPGFIHAKMFISDDREAIVGSANMDYRSLYLHFENCCAFYGGKMVQEVLADFNHTIPQCHEVTPEEAKSIPFPKWIAQIFLRFFSPLM